MKLIKEIRENVAVLTLKGDFDSFVCQPFIEQVNAIHGDGIHNLVIDLRLILFINSTGVGTLIKAHKEAKKQGGSLVLSRPSNFVTGVLETLGLNDLFKIYDDPEKAISELGASTDGADLAGENSVIIHIPGQTKETCVAKMVSLEEETMTLNISDPKDELTADAAIKVKFRLPLFMKSRYFDATARITETVHSTTGVRIKCTFTEIAAEDRKAIAQFVEEMKYLRGEARKGE